MIFFGRTDILQCQNMIMSMFFRQCYANDSLYIYSLCKYPDLEISNKSLLRRTHLASYQKGKRNLYKKVTKTYNNCNYFNNCDSSINYDMAIWKYTGTSQKQIPVATLLPLINIIALYLEKSPNECTEHKTTHLKQS